MKQDVVSYLTSIPCWFLATTDAAAPAQPHVRPFSFAALDGGRIVFCTARGKDVYEQLERNPLFELSAWQPGRGWLIVRGSAVLDVAVSAATREAGFRHLTGLGESYAGPADERLAFFTFENGYAELDDITGETRVIDLDD